MRIINGMKRKNIYLHEDVFWWNVERFARRRDHDLDRLDQRCRLTCDGLVLSRLGLVRRT